MPDKQSEAAGELSVWQEIVEECRSETVRRINVGSAKRRAAILAVAEREGRLVEALRGLLHEITPRVGGGCTFGADCPMSLDGCHECALWQAMGEAKQAIKEQADE